MRTLNYNTGKCYMIQEMKLVNFITSFSKREYWSLCSWIGCSNSALRSAKAIKTVFILSDIIIHIYWKKNKLHKWVPMLVDERGVSRKLYATFSMYIMYVVPQYVWPPPTLNLASKNYNFLKIVFDLVDPRSTCISNNKLSLTIK